jgi:hypothetical protein
MSALDDLLVIEEGFWRAAGLRDSYAAHLADDSVHVFPGWGVTSDNERVLQAVDSVDPWESFEIEEPRGDDERLPGDGRRLETRNPPQTPL